MERELGRNVDALVVGAGPAGSQTALLLAEAGHRTLLVEDDPVVGVPMQCAGLVTPRLFKIVRFPPEDVVLNHIRGALLFSPKGRTIELDAGRPHAVVMDRSRFDQRVAETAVDHGVVLWTHTRYESAARHNGTLDVTLTRRDGEGREETVEVRARLIVGADGVQSNVGRQFGIPRPKEFLPGYEADLEGCHFERPDVIPVFTDPKLAPGFFSWAIPVSKTRGRAGLCMRLRRRSALQHFEEFRRHPQAAPYLKDAHVAKPIVGTVPLGIPSRYTADHVMLVGDAAAMPKPTSGGGIYTGLEGAVHCAHIADQALRKNRLERAFLRRYETNFDASRVGREIRLGWHLRKFFLSLTERQIEEAFRLLDNNRARAVLDRFGDIDHPGHLLLPLIAAEPRLLKFLPRALRAAFRGATQQG